MRIRTTLAAAACAVGLAMSFPVSAHAAEGSFDYFTYVGERALVNPPTGECVTLPEVADPDVPPALYAFNATATEAQVFAGTDCEGAYLFVQPFAGLPTDFGFRSVLLT